jgi:hypothetical protein
MSVTIYPVRVNTRLDAVDVPLVDMPPIDESFDLPLPATSIGPPAATVPAAAGLRS